MKRFLVMSVLIIHSLCAYAQNTLTGRVIDAEDHKPVQYTSIGVTRMPNGTVSDIDGVFRIILDDKVADTDTLKFSSIGYRGQAFTIKDLREILKNGPLIIALYKSVNQLRQVPIVAKKVHVKLAGYDKNSKLFGLGFGSGGVGSQGGVIIPVSHPQTNLQNVGFFIIKNPFRHLVFRVNLYQMVNGKPVIIC